MFFKKLIPLLYALCLFSTSTFLSAGESKINAFMATDKYAGQKEKNGISLVEILKNFDKEFTFVSSHYREDKFEIRLIYGNKLAMEGLKSKDLNFKDGSILYKVVYPIEHDPNFDASLVPEAQPMVRQVMVRDAKKYKKYNGWGYAVFTEKGETLSGDPDATLSTCFACHQLVQARNNIFSYPMETVTPNAKIALSHYTKGGLANSKELSEKLFKFKLISFATLDPEDKIYIKQKTKKINYMDGEMLKMDFSGYMPELSSFLVKKTRTNGMPSLAIRLFNHEKIFLYSYMDHDSKECKGKEKLFRYGWGKSTSKEKSRYTSFKKCYSLL